MTQSTARSLFLSALARSIPRPTPGASVIVGVAGVDGAGKTRLADDLAVVLCESDRVVRVSIDGFHHQREHRYRRGRGSVEGFWRDSYDYDRFLHEVVAPFRAGTGTYLSAAHDVETDAVLTGPRRPVPRGVILLVDGIFLHRPELREVWDASIFLDVPFDVSVPRMAVRDESSPDPDAEENARYVGGQRLYLRECRPAERATILVDYADLEHPVIDRGGS